MKTGERIKRRRLEVGLTLREVAEAVGVAESTISRYETSGIENMGLDKVKALADALKVNPAYIAGWDDMHTGTVKIPILKTVKNGIEVRSTKDIDGYVEISRDVASTGEHYALKIKGDMMEPYLVPGDVAIIKKTDYVHDNEIAVLSIGKDIVTVARYVSQRNGIKLVPSNPAYDYVTLSRDEVKANNVRVIGKIVEIRRDVDFVLPAPAKGSFFLRNHDYTGTTNTLSII